MKKITIALICLICISFVSAGTIDLYVNSFDSRITEWTNYGTTPYLNIQDQPTNWILSPDINDKIHGDFFFDDMPSNATVINSVVLHTYSQCPGGKGTMQFDGYIWNGVGYTKYADICHSIRGVWGWDEQIVGILNTPERVNNTKIYLKTRPFGTGAGSADTMFLRVDYRTTCWFITDSGLLDVLDCVDDAGKVDIGQIMSEVNS